ncbi:HPr family phosphocarrier protein [Natronospira bacteriovora]|uniref:HPr family phosphocarrier protein n=1 Tax=Natronospira bacteriovora TaxID=3069753 RepID=A0ABU0W694_9GAMM|nr:HPr family phosphocarrier protein [Natronospira sp. AB-CW4]MDQ2069543.1 HPr family phosphocarrier protein [Natronospira sp. AB-CW4]
MTECDVVICNKLGMHARAATRFVTAASRFKADIRVEKDGRDVSGKSIMGLMMLAASKGTRLHIRAEGEDAREAVEQLCRLVKNRFDEGE